MKTQTNKNYSHRQMFIIRNESAAILRRHQYCQPSLQTPVSFFVHGQSLAPPKQKNLNKPTPREIKFKTTLKQLKLKLSLLKKEQQEIKQQVIQNSLIFKSNLQQIKSTQEFNIKSIEQYFSQQTKFFQEDISKLKQQIELINFQVAGML
ncbi:unnamed protein product (macronuclear) [Paramecium tetraurelia]|uniref:Uncharacterized protein n=1 Tax=Paramecium tetraurelia TaxID=5888 RepID=A0DFG7_PARTE|nr:uncharacterized protein GSPATT00016597001 [Paramecium tetraurelia]CAK81784.1 unnamed protein product [Paramecium tetraurelia]|eukprot:XP_001449181.1 hypothetical protein (macronuclear) [Paramecium tetraurelia strain d4-2]